MLNEGGTMVQRETPKVKVDSTEDIIDSRTMWKAEVPILNHDRKAAGIGFTAVDALSALVEWLAGAGVEFDLGYQLGNLEERPQPKLEPERQPFVVLEQHLITHVPADNRVRDALYKIGDLLNAERVRSAGLEFELAELRSRVRSGRGIDMRRALTSEANGE